jgi:hypothetical protein
MGVPFGRIPQWCNTLRCHGSDNGLERPALVRTATYYVDVEARHSEGALRPVGEARL